MYSLFIAGRLRSVLKFPMYVSHPTPGMNTTGIIHSLQLVSHSKDSLHLKWHVSQPGLPGVLGYCLQYTAKGSKIRMAHKDLTPDTHQYVIPQLHEDTDYSVCINVQSNSTECAEDPDMCIDASTSVDSLSLALGSTFGAFLALGIIVLFVFIAKWQHTRRLRKQLAQVTPSGESYDSMVQMDRDHELSDISLRVHDDTIKLDVSSQSSQPSTVANGSARGRHANIRQQSCDSCGGELVIEEEEDELSSGHMISQTMGEEPSPVPSTSSGIGLDPPSSSLLLPPPPPYVTLFTSTDMADTQDDRPPDVRPKDKALMDLTHLYANKKYFEEPQTSLRPNMSCNW